MFGEQKWLADCQAERMDSYEHFCQKINTIFYQNTDKKYLLTENILSNGIKFKRYFYLELQNKQRNYKLVKTKYYVFLSDDNDFVTPQIQQKVYTSSYILRKCQNFVLYPGQQLILPPLVKDIQNFFLLNKTKTEAGLLSKSRTAAILEKINVPYTLVIGQK